MNDLMLGTLAVLLSVATYLIGYATGRYCDRCARIDDPLKAINDARLADKIREKQRFTESKSDFTYNVRVMGRDVIDVKTKDGNGGTGT